MLFKQKASNLRISQNHKGVTLVEVIAVIAVLSVVMAAVTGFVLTGTKMSAKVSGTATASAREQTAVEFIQKTLQGMQATTIAVPDEVGDQWQLDAEQHSTEGFRAVYKVVTNEQNTTYVPMIYHTDDGKVVYNHDGKEVELCSGTIYFEAIDANTNTVTYYLNGAKHVVHLRTA